jgi:hypothetical protein
MQIQEAPKHTDPAHPDLGMDPEHWEEGRTSRPVRIRFDFGALFYTSDPEYFIQAAY